MSQTKLSKWLKVVIAGTGICGLVIYFYIFPVWGKSILDTSPEFTSWYWPWLIFIWLTSVPCYAALICGWRIASEIGRDNSFSGKNAALLKWISLLAAGDSAFFFAGNILFFFLGMNELWVIFLSLFVIFAGIAVTVAAAALSHLVLKAAKLREENDLTI